MRLIGKPIDLSRKWRNEAFASRDRLNKNAPFMSKAIKRDLIIKINLLEQCATELEMLEHPKGPKVYA